MNTRPLRTAATAATPLTTAVGLRGIAFLHRVSAGSPSYRIAKNADRDAIGRALQAGHVKRLQPGGDLVVLTEAGRAFLDKLMRCE
ncbi:hypothetical protein LAV84_06820 [Rhizobium sp. VS19-DR104.2]|uniref:hypothetical protein n=1 Tax=unclassified Rhizobium TaxID=2613769 RepID=UPI001CC61BC8|nr:MULTISPECIES: hypothetical protein [unclassified Rhizobium]MBZ5760259.1 hypothetical protein [Rhizobium sp. VS19-DR96]MBZ5766897.1 hypothetical protein [Rhizobium sp. VS19-DR129.2]MBZ5773110.1 hypothetical protein [Rhizobium sp. VS19-DRK62.2]MBZ5784094.1 hypothetical protein [Rhizobium sp. VS19-DR121]MBZ5802454.1 hypothetical protein [Rhizobium sp. VS19-DR181]